MTFGANVTDENSTAATAENSTENADKTWSGGGGTRVGFGWVCATQASKCRPRFRKDL